MIATKAKHLTIQWLLFACLGCGQLPLISENRKNFPPWEKLPPGNGIIYLEKFVRDPGHDPLYLAKMRYTDQQSLQRIIDTFGLSPQATLEPPASWVGEANPAWFQLSGMTKLYIRIDYEQNRCAQNLWVNEVDQVVILERTWY